MSRKRHDPMKTEIIIYNDGRKETIKVKHTKKMDMISKEITRQTHLMAQEYKDIRDKYTLSPGYSDSSKAKTEEELAYEADGAEVIAKYNRIISKLNAEYAAMFLIANNIARRGKLLHADIAIEKLEKMRHNGCMHAYVTELAIDESIAPEFTSFAAYAPNLHYFLFKKFGVVLMDQSMAKSVQNEIDELTRYADPKYTPSAYRKLQQRRNFLKKFHQNVRLQQH